MRSAGRALWGIGALMWLLPAQAHAASHREAPVTSFDRTADITDFFAFRTPAAPGENSPPDTITAIMCTDPLLEPSNGPNYFPFDGEVVYEICVDNDHDAVDDLCFLFLFGEQLTTRLPGVPVGIAGAGNGVPAPPNSPAGVPPGTPLIPPAVTSLSGAGSQGLGVRQEYQVAVRQGDEVIALQAVDGDGPLFAVPTNVGPRTMPNYEQLYQQGVRRLESGIRVFAGTVDDAFNIDLGAAFDSLNFRNGGVLTAAQDSNDNRNFQPDDVAGYNVNCLAVEAPIAVVAEDENQIGLWGTTSRSQVTTRNPGEPVRLDGPLVQVQRMANPLFNELLIGTDQKDLWSRSRPADDAQFTDLLRDPVIVRIGQAAFAATGTTVEVPDPPRNDLAVLVQYSSGPPGPIADLLRLDVTIPPTPANQRSRLGGCGGDPGGFPNGRRLTDDVTDCFLRVGFGLLVDGFDVPRIGDGVNTNDVPFRNRFPFLGLAQSGRESSHDDP